MERRHLARGEWSQLVHLYIAEAEQAASGGMGLPPDPEWAAGAYVMAGELALRRLSETAQAGRLYRQALAYVPGYRPAIDGLESLLTRSRALGELAQLLEEERARPDVSPERADYLDETLARLYRGPLGEGSRAVAALRRLAERHPDD